MPETSEEAKSSQSLKTETDQDLEDDFGKSQSSKDGSSLVSRSPSIKIDRLDSGSAGNDLTLNEDKDGENTD